ncbi:MAG: ABC transporter permease, partial [Clostridia bacterium]|nr:ABC transporter permease [Clostridia bacterium]
PESFFSASGIRLMCGRLPKGETNEVALSEMVYKMFKLGGFATGEKVYDTIEKPEDLLGRKVTLSGVELEIVGIFDTSFPEDRYQALLEDSPAQSTVDLAKRLLLDLQFNEETANGLSRIAAVGEGFIERVFLSQPVEVYSNSYGTGTVWLDSKDQEATWLNTYTSAFSGLSHCPEEAVSSILWVDGAKETLQENEVLIPLDSLMVADREDGFFESYGFRPFDPEKDMSLLREGGVGLTLAYENMATGTEISFDNARIVGLVTDSFEIGNYYDPLILSDSLFQKILDDQSAVYDRALAKMPSDEAGVYRLVQESYDESLDTVYRLNNAVIFQLDLVNQVLVVLSGVFVAVGIGFAIFSMIMLGNFIATSITYKKHDIGILRAIGSRSMDVFRIFFSESFVIAMISFVLSFTATMIVTAVINAEIRNNTGLLVTILHSGIRQCLLLFVLSVAISWLASLLPVLRFASKKPIDAIRDR